MTDNRSSVMEVLDRVRRRELTPREAEQVWAEQGQDSPIAAAPPGGLPPVVWPLSLAFAWIAWRTDDVLGREWERLRFEMALGAVWMMHEGSALTFGTAEEHEATIAGLEAVNAAMADLYARKSGVPVDAVRDMMARETWMTPDEACDAGFADGIVGEAEPRKPARFPYAARYKHPPAVLLNRLPKARARPEPPPIADDEPLDPAELAALCLAAEQPEITAELIRSKATLPQARARLDVMAQIRPMLAIAGPLGKISPELKAEALSGRLTIAQVRERIFEDLAAASDAIVIDHHRPMGNGAPNTRAMGRASMEKILRSQGMEPVNRDGPPPKPRTPRESIT